ncbi:MAG: carboxypeptidase regulatory-like domain-containing protein [Terrabacter sp.]|nr:carboxypeptidase regulatory-like domain-containing protein [Terrabacter sp.]
MFSHRLAVGRARGTIARRAARRLLSALTAATVALGVLPLAAPSASAATYTIKGRVTGLSSTGAVVGVGDAGLWIYDANYDDAGWVTFNSDGTYTATFSSPGPYKIEAGCWGTMTCASQWGIEWYADQGDFDSATPVTAGTTATVADIRLDRRSTIRGTVKNILGQPVQAAEVSVSRSTGGQVVTATPGSDGTFTLTGVEAGPSNLHAEDTSGRHLYEGESWNGTASTPDYVDWSVPAGATVTGVNFVLDPWTGVVVTVTDEAGKPLENINWDLLEYRPAEGDWLGQQYGPKLTSADGTVAVGTEVGTTYTFCVSDTWYDNWAPATRYQDRCWDGAATEATATPFTVTTETRRRDLTIVLPVAGKGLTAREPFVSGTPTVGSTLTVDPGTWAPSGVALTYEWMKPNGAGTGFDTIPGATGRTFTVTSDLLGTYVFARVTGTLTGYRSAQYHSNGVEIRSTAPTLASPLTITGSGVAGTSLNATHGAITPAGDWSPGYTWVVGGVPQDTMWGGLSPLALTSAMVGQRITLRMSAYLDGASLQVSATGPVVLAGTVSGTTPTVTGTAKVGSTLTATAGTWGPAPVTLAYQWYRSGVAISGATATTYALTASDLGKAMTVKVTGSKTSYASTSKTSAATAAVAAGTLTAPTPTISGTKAVGYTLAAVPGTWGPAPVTLAYQWYRSGTAISGATASTYKLTTTDQTKTITVRVTGSKSGYTTVARTSAATTAVLGSFTAPTPTLSGTQRVGYTLTANPGTWSPVPTTLAYQWYRSGTAISGATAKTYRLTTSDKGGFVKVRVTGARSGYLTKSVYSAQTAAIG